MRSDNEALPDVIDAGTVPRWDEEADVLVVGYGMAGACAALEAVNAGADALIIERFSGHGGTSAVAGGHFYLGGGTPVQTACGFEDSAEEMEKFLTAITPSPIPEKIHDYSFDSVAHFHWLEAQGIAFERSFYPHKTMMQPGTEGLIWSGNEEVHPYRDMARPAPRGHKVSFPGMEGGGGFALQHLDARFRAAGGRVMTDARVDALVRDEGGICGVGASAAGGRTVHLRARRGVVLAGGGFGQNRAMVRHFLPKFADAGERVEFIGAPGEDGSAIRLGQSAGGRTVHMEELRPQRDRYHPSAGGTGLSHPRQRHLRLSRACEVDAPGTGRRLGDGRGDGDGAQHSGRGTRPHPGALQRRCRTRDRQPVRQASQMAEAAQCPALRGV